MAPTTPDEPEQPAAVRKNPFLVLGRKQKVRDMVADGLRIAMAAVRLTVKNRILVEVIMQGADFDSDRFAEVAQTTLRELAGEADADAQRLERQAKSASTRRSYSTGTHDYRRADLRNLRRRRKQSEEVAETLRARADDADVVGQIVEQAREAAWDEVERNLDRTLNIEAAHPELEPDYEQQRVARMQSIRLVDLPKLSSESRNRRGSEEEAETAVQEA